MLADTDWTAAEIAGAFVVGAALGTLATIRVMRVVFGYIQPRHMIRGAQRPPPPEGDEGL